jgi:hypothetical protein
MLFRLQIGFEDGLRHRRRLSAVRSRCTVKAALVKDGAEKLGARRMDEAGTAVPAETVPVGDNSQLDLFATVPVASNDNDRSRTGMNGATPQRRGPGRPRKNPIQPPAGGDTHG